MDDMTQTNVATDASQAPVVQNNQVPVQPASTGQPVVANDAAAPVAAEMSVPPVMPPPPVQASPAPVAAPVTTPVTADAVSTPPAPAANEKVDLELFKNRIMQDLGLENLEGEKRKEFEDKLEQLVNDRIINLIILYMEPAKVQDFADLMEAGDVAKILDYAAANIPNFYDKIIEEMSQIRNELLTNVSQKSDGK
jgi:hypothetical protein